MKRGWKLIFESPSLALLSSVATNTSMKRGWKLFVFCLDRHYPDYWVATNTSMKRGWKHFSAYFPKMINEYLHHVATNTSMKRGWKQVGHLDLPAFKAKDGR
jgi:hypothetical protein